MDDVWQNKNSFTTKESYELLVDTFDFHLPQRKHWRACFRGEERASAQRLLLHIARSARQGAHVDQLAIYRAAHAVLPLEGADLVALTRLLIEVRPVSLEWADVLVSALREAPAGGASWMPPAIDALREIASIPPASTSERIKLRSLLNQMQDFGLQPSWLKAASSEFISS
jgi:hypothetical protein